MLVEMFLDKIEGSLPPAGDLKLVPSIENRKIWDSVPEDLKKKLIKKAEKYLEFEWPLLSASKRLLFTRTGDRRTYERLYMKRRTVLGYLVIGECLENRGRFIDDIVNGIWCICEESNWLLPVHDKDRNFKKLPLPDTKNMNVSIFAAETGELLSYVYYMLKNLLDSVTPLICKRIEYEVRRNLLTPYMERDDFLWMGFAKNNVNNFNPWINLGVLTSCLLIEKNLKRRVETVKKTIRSIDNFICVYGEDGGCDEGADYWAYAAGKLFNFLDIIYRATNGKIDVFRFKKIKEMGKFIQRMHISNKYFVNFADGKTIVKLPAELVYRYGKRICDKHLSSLGAYRYPCYLDKISKGEIGFSTALYAVINSKKIMEDKGKIHYIKDNWLPSIQVMTAREKEDTDRGLYLAAKGGHNNEHHNHNDVGNFIVYYNGLPCIIDVGVETYTRKTFSKDRYSIWTMQSQYHNLPKVNGVMQSDGYRYNAANVSYKKDDFKVELNQNIEKTYPADAKINTWKRSIIMNRQENSYIDIIDDFKLKDYTSDISFTLMTLHKPFPRNGELTFKNSDIDDIIIEFNGSKFEADINEITINDSGLKRSWGDVIYRVLLKAVVPMKEDISKIRIKYLL